MHADSPEAIGKRHVSVFSTRYLPRIEGKKAKGTKPMRAERLY